MSPGILRRDGSKASAWLAVVGAVGALGTTSLAVFAGGQSARTEINASISASQVAQLQTTGRIALSARQETERLRTQLDLLATRSDTSGAKVEFARLRASVDELSKRQLRIEDAISKDPAKALELPLLRRDLENLKDGQLKEISSLQKNVDQIWDLSKWLVGGGAISLLAIALSTFLARWKVPGSE